MLNLLTLLEDYSKIYSRYIIVTYIASSYVSYASPFSSTGSRDSRFCQHHKSACRFGIQTMWGHWQISYNFVSGLKCRVNVFWFERDLADLRYSVLCFVRIIIDSFVVAT